MEHFLYSKLNSGVVFEFQIQFTSTQKSLISKVRADNEIQMQITSIRHHLQWFGVIKWFLKRFIRS
jgi:hypothetical protein